MSYVFGDCVLDTSVRSLRRGGSTVAVEPKVFDLLAYLLQQRGRVVSREVLKRQLWPDTAVSHAALSRLVKEARRVTGDDGRRQRVIQTCRGRGFRFVADARERGRVGSGLAYVGREALLRRLDTCLEETAAARGRCLLVSGEPGMGKTRTAEELAERGRQRGFQVTMTWCPESPGAPGYWPWTQALRGVLAEGDDSTQAAWLGASAHQIARLVPGLEASLGGMAPPPPVDREAERFRLFDGVRAFLTRSTRQAPRVIVIDDLHRADAESVELLDFLSHDLSSLALLVLCTYREPELEAQPQLARSLARLASRPSAEHWPLGGLSAREVDLFAAERIGRSLDAAVVELLCEKTEGNPLFLGEILGHALSRDLIGTALGREAWSEITSHSLGSAIQLRLRSLPATARSVLSEAAAIGLEFDADLLRQVTSASSPELRRALEEAVGLRLLVPRSHGVFCFSHALVRELLYDAVPRPARARLHAALVRCLQDRNDGACDLDALAHHCFEAIDELGVFPAIDAAERAGARALHMHAFDVAARHCERALRLLEAGDSGPPGRRCGLLLRLGEARRLLGEGDASRDAFRRAAQLAEGTGDPLALAEAALGFAGLYAYGPPDAEVVALLERAADELGPEQEALRARILGRLASEWTLSEDRERRQSLRRRAWLTARHSGELGAIVDIIAHPDHGIWDAMVAPRDRIALASEYAHRCARAGLGLWELGARVVLLDELLRCGHLDDYDDRQGGVDGMAAEVGEPRLLWARQLQGFTRRLMAGDLDDAERRAREALDFARRHLDGRAGFAVWARQLAVLRSEQSRLGELRETFSRIAAAAPTASNQALHAWVCAGDGDVAAARETAAPLLAAGAEAIAGEPMAGANAAVLAEVCAFLGDPEPAPPLLALLQPHAGLNAIRTYAASHGPADHYMGLLEGLRGRPEPAERRQRAALALAEKAGDVPWVARCRRAWIGASAR